ncbi:hypothetical protein K8O93_15500 [Gordonia bronchialis]|uniref:hypothetical protein n=1 Tax=Gordonia bronchialis TaxID=2054 RepID=UPI001CBB0800|nr:hypothetical protein [Gordonia bronchialis]UAK36653.1 hypothetical protein K8O93_15500 [Gordonia bronchialis]
MTRPPEDDPYDPQRRPPVPPQPEPPQPEQQPGTRQFSPDTDPAAIGEPGPPTGYETGYESGYEPTGPTDQYGSFGPPPSQAYASAGPGPGEPLQYGSEPPKNTGRTVGLVLAVVAALVVLGIVAFLILRDGGDDKSTTAAGSSTTSSAPSTPSTTSTTTTTSETTTTTTTTSTAPSNQVTYQLTGGGSVITVTYRASGRPGFIANTGTPWSESVRVNGGTAEITAIVISGNVTCTIMQDGQQISSATSGPSPIPLRCAAALQ